MSGDRLVISAVEEALADANGDVVGIERALDREQPIAALVLLADADRLIGGAVELLAHLDLDQRALLLDHDDQVQPVGELLELALAQRPRTGDLVDANAEIVALDLVEAEFVERLADVEIALSHRDDADLRLAAARDHGAVELVGAHEGQHGVALVIVQPRLHAENGVVETNVEPTLGHLEIVRHDDLHALQAAVDRGCRLDRLVHAFERHPGAGEARHGPAVETVIEKFLNARRIQDRDHHVDEMEFGLMRGGRRFRRMVVAHQREHAAVLGRSGEIGVAEHVAGAVDAGTLAVPDREYAVELALAAQFRSLGAPHRGGGEVLVEAGLERYVVGSQDLGGAHELLVEPAERGAAVAGNIASGIEAGAAVALLLHQRQAHQRLIAGHEDAALAEIVFVVERDVIERHGAWPLD